MSNDTFVILSVLLAVVVIAVLATALIIVRQGLERISKNLATLGDALDGIGRINDSGVRILHSARALRKVAVGR